MLWAKPRSAIHLANVNFGTTITPYVAVARPDAYEMLWHPLEDIQLIATQELLAWWHVVLEHIRVHESQHVRIFQDYVSALPARVVGQPCNAWDAIIAQWSAEVVAAQGAFDVSESHWELPTYAGLLGG